MIMTTSGDFMALELQIQMKKTECEVLEAKLRAMEAEKRASKEQLEALKGENDELKERIRRGGKDGNKEDFGGAKRIEGVVDLTNDDVDEDRVTELMIEIRVLEIEKEKAQRDAKAWENKFKELELQMLHLQQSLAASHEEWPLAEKSIGRKEKVVNIVDDGSIFHSPGKQIGDLQAVGSSAIYTPCKRDDYIKEEPKGLCLESKVECTTNQHVRRQLPFEQERSPGKKMAPSTPAGARPSSLAIVDINDSDEEPNNTHVQLPIDVEGSGKAMTSETGLKQISRPQNNERDIGACNEKILLVSTPKRKRASNIVMSDTDSDSDDNIPIARLKRMNLRELSPVHNGSHANATASVVDTGKEPEVRPMRRLVALRKCRGKGGSEKKPPSDTTETKCGQGISTNLDTEDGESDEAASESEGESLGGFIVDSSDVSEGDEASEESDYDSDGQVDFSEILSNLQRKKEKNFKWELEADMLADFGKDDELCMRAVCALYRQQTSEEKVSKGSLYYNNRGFNKFHAFRGTTLAEFLADGNPQGDLKKSVKELEEYDPKAVKECRTLATNYSKQLFAIYKNKEDPLFLP